MGNDRKRRWRTQRLRCSTSCSITRRTRRSSRRSTGRISKRSTGRISKRSSRRGSRRSSRHGCRHGCRHGSRRSSRRSTRRSTRLSSRRCTRLRRCRTRSHKFACPWHPPNAERGCCREGKPSNVGEASHLSHAPYPPGGCNGTAELPPAASAAAAEARRVITMPSRGTPAKEDPIPPSG